MEDTKVKERDSNIELLRIVLMFSIILHHLILHNNLVFIDGINTGIAVILCGFAKVAVNCFILIMGFFSYKSKWNVKKIVKIIAESLFYSIIFMILFERNINGKVIWNNIKQYWFINRIYNNICN